MSAPDASIDLVPRRSAVVRLIVLGALVASLGRETAKTTTATTWTCSKK
jgi:hypothetical protein